MVTETMLVIALKQRRWRQAEQIAMKLKTGDICPLYEKLENASKRAAKDDYRAAVLLKLWASVRWEEMRSES